MNVILSYNSLAFCSKIYFVRVPKSIVWWLHFFLVWAWKILCRVYNTWKLRQSKSVPFYHLKSHAYLTYSILWKIVASHITLWCLLIRLKTYGMSKRQQGSLAIDTLYYGIYWEAFYLSNKRPSFHYFITIINTCVAYKHVCCQLCQWFIQIWYNHNM